MNKEYRTKNRYFCAILYEDDPNFKKYFENILKLYIDVTYIRHNRDIKEKEDAEEEEYKKPHYHVLFKVGENARTLQSISKQIQIPQNYLQGCNKRAMLMYLIHLNNPEKTQYSVEEVKGPLRQELTDILVKREPEENKLSIIMSHIIQNGINSINDLIVFGIESGLIETIRKYQFILTKAIEERNKKCLFKNMEKKRKYKS